MYTDGRLNAKGWSVMCTHTLVIITLFGMHPVHKVARDATAFGVMILVRCPEFRGCPYLEIKNVLVLW